MAISLTIHHEHLTRAIRRFGGTAAEMRQVARRLAQLLPQRLLEVRRECGAALRAAAAPHEQRRASSVARAERLALTHPRYLDALDELVNLHAHARQARVEYETHLMLLEARRSLRALRVANFQKSPQLSGNRS